MKPIDAVEARLPLNQLIEWAGNPRKTRDTKDIGQMATNLLALGQQSPLIVFKGAGETLYKTIEGETRRLGFNELATANKIAGDAEVRCWILPETTSEEQLLAVALASNTVRREMNPIEEMEAYTSLAKAGMKLKAIGETFGVEQRTIRQRLALGDLTPEARDLIRSGKRQMGWAQAMTLASPAAQQRIVAEIGVNATSYPDGASVRAEVTRDSIPASSALFAPSELADCLVSDLFSTDSDKSFDYFSDTEAFWKRQRVEIDALIEKLSQTHKDVKLFDRIRFDDAGWTRGGEPSESTAVVIVYDDGAVKVEEGMIAPAIDDSFDDGEGSFLSDAEDHYTSEHEDTGNGDVVGREDGAAIEKVEVNPLDNATKETVVYLTGQVTAALKLQVASNPTFAMAVVITGALTRRGPVPSLSPSGSTVDAEDQTSQAFMLLNAKRAARDRIVTMAGIAGMNTPAQALRKLLALDPALLAELFAYTVADSITASLDDTTADIFDALGADIVSGWRIEPAYLKGLNTAQIRSLTGEVCDPNDPINPRSSRSQLERAIMEAVESDALQGNFMGDNGWMPPQLVKAMKDAETKRLAAQAAAAQVDDGTDDVALANAA